MLIQYQTLKDELFRILQKAGMKEQKADLCAAIFAGNSRDGVHSHGLNRFPLFVKSISEGLINTSDEPQVVSVNGCIENWDGQLAPGMYTATKATARAVEIAKANGLGCVAVRNTNHWMRGGTYGWQAAEMGCIAICATNAIANMPPWGGKDATLGNNPLVIAVPRTEGHLVLDMAMSQFSYGKMNEYHLSKRNLPMAGGYDVDGNISVDPAAIITSKRTMPVGYWKGSALSMMIDVLVAGLSGGKTVAGITSTGKEYGVSQFFLCISPMELDARIIDEIIQYAKSSEQVDDSSSIRYPGESTLKQRRKSEAEGVFVNDQVWEEVRAL